VKRRELMLLLASAIAGPRVLWAQQKAIPVVGYLSGSSPGPNLAPFLAALRQGLSETGYIERQNLGIAALAAHASVVRWIIS
jgi:putative ABC transport system substrate-binding protein